MKVIARSSPSCCDVHLVGADVLGDAAGLALDHLGLADRVEQLGLTVVDVTHDGHDRRPGDQPLLVDVGVEVDVEPREQLAVLVLGADDLHVEAEVLAEQQQRLVGARLGRRHHLAQVEHLLDERTRVGVDLVGEVGQRRAARQPDHLALTARGARAHRRRGQVVELLPPLLLRLAARGLAAATAEGAAGTAGTTARPPRPPPGRPAPRRRPRRGHRHRDRRGNRRRQPGPPTATGTTAVAAATAAATGTAADRHGTAAAATGTAGTTAAAATGTAAEPPPPPPAAGTTGTGPAGHRDARGAGSASDDGLGRGPHRGRVGPRRHRRPGWAAAAAGRPAGRRPPAGVMPNGLLPPLRGGRGRGRPGRRCRRAGTRARPAGPGRGGRAGPGRGAPGRVGRRLPARGVALLRGRLRGPDGGLLLGLQRRGARLGGGHLDVVRARRLGHRAGAGGPGPGLRRRAVLAGSAPLGGAGRDGRGRGGALPPVAGALGAAGGGRPAPAASMVRAQPPGDGSLDRARRGLDELAHLLELGEHGLALDPELLRQLVYAGLACHCTPHLRGRRAAPAATSLRALEA